MPDQADRPTPPRDPAAAPSAPTPDATADLPPALTKEQEDTVRGGLGAIKPSGDGRIAIN